MLVVVLALASAGWAAGPASKHLEALRDGSVAQRRAALRSLADSGGGGAVAAIVDNLKHADGTVRDLAEYALWAIWARSGDREVDQWLRRGTRIMTGGNPRVAIEIFDRIVDQKPEFAEGYNKRATAWYLLGAYHRSLADIRHTLKRNPFHFGALSGAGYCMIQLERYDEALLFFQRALQINPNLTGVVVLRKKIEARLGGNTT